MSLDSVCAAIHEDMPQRAEANVAAARAAAAALSGAPASPAEVERV